MKEDLCEMCEGVMEEFEDETESKVVWGLMCKKCGHKRLGAKLKKWHEKTDKK